MKFKQWDSSNNYSEDDVFKRLFEPESPTISEGKNTASLIFN